MVQFPETLAAARKIEIDQWGIGDALLLECGAPGDSASLHNGSSVKLAAASAELQANGLDYAEITLRVFRDISHLYPADTRVSAVGWSIHRVVPGPEMLSTIVEGFRELGERLTVKAAEAMVAKIRADNLRQIEADRQKESEEALAAELAAKKRQQDAARAAKTAASTAERDRHTKAQEKAANEAEAARKKRVAAARTPKAADIAAKLNTPPVVAHIPHIVLVSSLLRNAEEASSLARQTKTILDDHDEDELSEDDIAAFREAALEAHQSWLELANDAARRIRANPRSHLAVVGED